MMKRFIALYFVIAAFLLAGSDNIRVSFRPARPEAGESVYVTVTAEVSDRSGAELILPEVSGIAKWNYNMRSDGSSMQFSNSGKPQISYRFVRQLLTLAPGKLVIPPFEVRSGSGKLTGKETTLEILPAGSRKKTDPAELKPFGKLFTSPQRPFRPGEKVKINIELFIPENMNMLNISGSDISGIGSAVMIKSPDGRSEFKQSPSYSTEVKGGSYNVFPYTAELRTAVSGDFFPEISIVLTYREVRSGTRDGFGDDIFDSFFGGGRNFGRQQRIRLDLRDNEGFKVIPLPPLPAGAVDLGLTGKWKCALDFGAPSCRSGEVVELELRLTSQNNGENISQIPFKPPQLEIPGFRVYPPEVIRKDNSLSVRWAMIPLSPGEKKNKFKFAYFDPEANRWQITEFAPVLAVTPGTVNVVSAPGKTVPEVRSAETAAAPAVPAGDPLNYLKAENGEIVLIPLLANQKLLISVLAAIGFILIITDLLFRRFRERLPARDRKAGRELKMRIKELCRKIKSSGNILETVRENGVADIAEASGLPAGSTAQDIADSIEEPELKEFFTSLARDSFAPGGKAVNLSPAIGAKLIKFLKHLILITVLFSGISLYGGKFDKANAAYNSGNYSLAAEEYRRLLSSGGVSVPLLYNLGCTEFKLGNYAAARVWFKRAGLLAPGDLECRVNLDLTEDKLQLPPAENAESFTFQLTVLRDSLCRPDQYLALAVGGLLLLCILFILRGGRGSLWRWSMAAAVLFLTVLCLLAAAGQSATTYSPDNLILTGNDLELHSLPVQNSAAVKKLLPGSDAVLIEKRGSWLRIEQNGSRGWIPEEQIMRVFPYGIW